MGTKHQIGCEVCDYFGCINCDINPNNLCQCMNPECDAPTHAVDELDFEELQEINYFN